MFCCFRTALLSTRNSSKFLLLLNSNNNNKKFLLKYLPVSSRKLSSESSSNEDETYLMNDPLFNWTAEEVRQRASSVTLIDVRNPDELVENGKIENSVNIPLGELEKALKEMDEETFEEHYKTKKPLKSDSLLMLCRAGVRSRRAMRLAHSHGFLVTAHMVGGFNAWKKLLDH